MMFLVVVTSALVGLGALAGFGLARTFGWRPSLYRLCLTGAMVPVIVYGRDVVQFATASTIGAVTEQAVFSAARSTWIALFVLWLGCVTLANSYWFVGIGLPVATVAVMWELFLPAVSTAVAGHHAVV